MTTSCERCGESFVIATKLVNQGERTVQIESLPAALEGGNTMSGEPMLNGAELAEHVLKLYGLIAVPNDVTRPAWVVSQYTRLGTLVGHRLHRVHVCPEHDADWSRVQEASAV